MKCIFGHKWTEWKRRTVRYNMPFFGDYTTHVTVVKTRECTRCGRMQMR